MNKRTLLIFSLNLLYITEYSNENERAEVGQLLVNGGNDVALSIQEIADALRARRVGEFQDEMDSEWEDDVEES